MRKRTYTFSEYKELQELNKIDRILGEIKKNKKMYSKLVLTIALILNNNEVCRRQLCCLIPVCVRKCF